MEFTFTTRFSKPVIEIETGQEPVIDAYGNQIMTKEQELDEAGVPILEDVEVKRYTGLRDNNDNPLLVTDIQKQPRLKEVPAIRVLKEAVENEDAAPEGLWFDVHAYDDSGTADFSFHIGAAALEDLSVAQRLELLRKEVEIHFFKAQAQAEAPTTWFEGLVTK